MRWWKVVGLAGLAGVAATGVVVARAERRRQAYTPDEIRARLHARVAAPDADGAAATTGPFGLGPADAGRRLLAAASKVPAQGPPAAHPGGDPARDRHPPGFTGAILAASGRLRNRLRARQSPG